MEKAERNFVVRYLALSRERLLEAINGLNQEQQRYRPAANRWSVADCVEHVTVTERAILEEIQRRVVQPPKPYTGQRVPDQVILKSFPRRTRMIAAPEFLPAGRWSTFEELTRQFESARERSLRFAAVTRSDLRNYLFAHPQFGELDCYQWLLFVAAHCERHARQAADVIAHPAFPRERDSATA
jgi:uncharacterized damage-inducible protein DinB